MVVLLTEVGQRKDEGFCELLYNWAGVEGGASPVAQKVKSLPAMQETWV